MVIRQVESIGKRGETMSSSKTVLDLLSDADSDIDDDGDVSQASASEQDPEKMEDEPVAEDEVSLNEETG